MADEQETGFTFVDRRGASDSGENTEPEAPVETAPESAEPATERGQPAFQVPHLKSTDRILMCLNWLHEGAWIALGLVQDPATEKIEQDLEGARVAIDCIGFLVSKVESKVDEATSRELKNLVRDLQLNFVQQQARAGQS